MKMRRTNVAPESGDLFRQIRSELVQLYPDKDDSKVVVNDSGMNSRFIAFSDQAETNWFSILEEADKQDKVEALLTAVIDSRFLKNELPATKERLLRLCQNYRVYQSKLQQKGRDESRLQSSVSAVSVEKHQAKRSSKRRIQILHLSDIQYGRHHVDRDGGRKPLYADADYTPQLEKLTADLDIIKNQGVRPELIVVTGDIAEWSRKKEYLAAEKFIGGIAGHLGIDRRFVVMVPGNHDINRNVCKSERLAAEEEDERFEPPYFEKFKYYQAFFEGFYQRAAFPDTIQPYRFIEEKLFVNFYFPEKGIAFVGLNSCIDESEIKPHYGNIGVAQLKKACAELNQFDPRRQMRRVALMHHNFLKSSKGDPESLIDADELKPILLKEGFSFILHGHQHIPRQEVTGKGDHVIHILATGSAGLDSETIPEIARRYQVITIDEARVKVYRRRFDNVYIHDTGPGSWVPDLNADATGIYDEFSLSCIPEESTDKPDLTIQPDHVPLKMPPYYAKWLAKQCQKMDIDRFRSHGRIVDVDLPEVFIPLFAHPPEGKNRSDKQADMRLTDKKEDIEALMARFPSLLIEGQAGSGKTTLMKHYCHALATSDAADCLPVLVFLRDLQPLAAEFMGLPASGAAAQRILDRYFVHVDCGLNMELVNAFGQAGKAVILLDGLDEVDADLRDLVAESMAFFQDRFETLKVVLTGRPHGLTGKAVDLFGARHVCIMDLEFGQVAEFVRKWFCAVAEAQPNACIRTADDLLSEMRAHPDVDELKDTPLMLTAVCMLYYDGGRLPGQRAELYDKFIEYLLHRRFPGEDDRVKVQRFLLTLAKEMHQKKVRTIERIPAINLLGQTAAQTRLGDRLALEREFDRIETKCGLMRSENRRYLFWHLSFQAFLAARAIVSQVADDHFEAIAKYWDDDWFHEMIALYIGYLSTTGNHSIAGGIIKKILAAEDKAPYARWRLAARALTDIHKGWREPATISAAENTLFEIMASEAAPKMRADAGDILGRLGDPRDLEAFSTVAGGRYRMSTGDIEIQPFELAKYPVTNGWYKQFVDAKAYESVKYWTPEGLKWLENKNATAPKYRYDRKWNCPNAPVVGVAWYEADAFCRWLTEKRADGRRYFLPDEHQWEAAAAGRKGREYPWGEWADGRCNSEEAGIEKTSAVGLFPAGDTPEGICDLAGNVWEWTRSDYHAETVRDDFTFDPKMQRLWDSLLKATGDEKKKIRDEYLGKLDEKDRQLPVLRGGSWDFDRGIARCDDRFRVGPFDRDDLVGFRCARTS
jgi:formylglycine-generating enzyme required for sulfatase activity/3',5'-cyclic AMP phosphodiesterase CpdA